MPRVRRCGRRSFGKRALAMQLNLQVLLRFLARAEPRATEPALHPRAQLRRYSAS